MSRAVTKRLVILRQWLERGVRKLPVVAAVQIESDDEYARRYM
jgi:hypothetical protein